MLLLVQAASLLVWGCLGALLAVASYCYGERCTAVTATPTPQSTAASTRAIPPASRAGAGPDAVKDAAYSSSDEDEEDTDEDEADLRVRMMLVVRQDIQLSPSTTASMVVDASLSVLKSIRDDATQRRDEWLRWYWLWNKYGVAKITLRCTDGEALLNAHRQATESGLPAAIVATPSGAPAVVAIGPLPAAKADPITGKLRLLA